MAIEQKVTDPNEKKTLDKKLDGKKHGLQEPMSECLKEDYKSEDYKVVEENLTGSKPEPGTKRTGFQPSTR